MSESNSAADAAARRRAKLLSRGADRLAQLQQQPPPPSSPPPEEPVVVDDSSTTTSQSTSDASPSSTTPLHEPFYGESLLADDASSTASPTSPASLVNLLLPGSAASSSSPLLAPDRLDVAAALKSLVIALVGAAVALLGEPTLGAAMSSLFVLWIVSELSIRFVAQRLAAPSAAPAPFGLAVVTDLTSSVYAVAGRLCVFVFSFAVAQHFALQQHQQQQQLPRE